MKLFKMFLIITLVVLIAQSCKNKSSTNSDITEDDTNNQVTITDRTGKEWDITHAVKEYGLEPGKFNYGLGPNAIQPINFPQVISEGMNGYPSDNSGISVIGVNINDDVRAYPVQILASHEVVNDRIGGLNVSVNY